MVAVAKETNKGGPIDAGASGLRARAHLRMALDIADTETVTIGGDVYEFDADATYTAGNIPVDVSGGLTPTVATAALVAAINASGVEPVSAILLGVNDILLVSDIAIDSSIALAETMAGAGNVIDAALANGVENTIDKARCVSHVPTANEVAAGVIAIPVDFEPTGAIVQVLVAATGLAKAWVGAITLDSTNNLVKIDNTGAVDWAVTDRVNVVIF